MKCPNCNSENIEETGKFDLTLVESTECRHDFQCNNCEALFQIIYAPIRTSIIELPSTNASIDDDMLELLGF